MSDKWILDENGEPKKCGNLMEWAKVFEDPKRIVECTTIGDSRVSTVFLGLDHGYGEGPPLIWETMVFEGKMDQEMDRCGGSRQMALEMHERMVSKVKESK